MATMAAPARSQSSTSLAKLYAGQQQALPGNETDFCNAFWGPGDKGYEVLMARLRGAGRTMEELKAFWKERIAIEEDYSKRLSKLSKQPLGRDEIGELKQCFDTLRAETERQSGTHQSMVTEMKTALESPSQEFILRLANLKRGFQASIEKQYKNKAMQEQHVNRARERYEQDCLKINSFTAQISIVQGKEQDKVQQKLDKSQSSVGQNEQDFKNFVRALEGTTNKWELEWKAFCDHVQDLEEDRLDFVRDNVWAYANAVSQVCVEDDSSCERIRCGLEAFDSQADMIHFVQGWGTGSKIPDAPRYINYSAGEAYPTHQTFHPARFTRISSRPIREPAPEPEHEQEQDQETEHAPDVRNGEQVFAALNLRDEPRQLEQPLQSAPVQPAPSPQVYNQAPQPAPQMAPPPIPENKEMPPPPVPQNRYDTASTTRTVDDDDPIARALADLRRDPPSTGSIRRGPSHRRPESTYSQTSVRSSRPVAPASPAMSHSSQRGNRIDTSLIPPASGHTAAALARSKDEFDRRTPNRNSQQYDYGNYADSVVGAHPASRPTSPSGQPPSASAPRAPSPAMMQPPNNPASPIADEVLSQYHQAFPGERSRPASRAGSISSRRSRGNSYIAPPAQTAPAPARSPSPAPRQGFVGIGAGRSPSPQPAPTQPLGIALDNNGGVTHDSMAEQYRRQYQPQQPLQQQPPMQQQPPQVSSPMQQGPSAGGYQRQSYQPPASPYQQQPPPQQRPVSGYGQYGQQAPQQQAPYQAPPQQSPYTQQQPPAQYDPRRQSYQSGQYANGQAQQQPQRAPSPQPQYHRAPSPQPQYNRAPSPQPQYNRAPSPQPQYHRQPSPQPQFQQPAQTYGGAPSQANYYGANARAPSPQPQQAPVGRSPSPQPGAVPENAPPTGQWSTTGLPVLFYVKALYDYNATSQAEFDFQAGDIIAVTSTPEDGWWSGELLDEARRVHGRTDFPSNFVCLF